MFKKDILIVDIEASGLDASKYELIQLAAVLLDKKTLKVKQEFASFIKPRSWEKRSRPAMKVNKIKREDLLGAPDLATVMKEFGKLFPPTKVIFTHYGGVVDIDYIRAAFKKLGRQFPYHPYDYHFFDLWSVCHVYAASHGLLKNRKRFTGFSLDDMARHFKVKIPGKRHDALTDCLVEAGVFRKLMAKLKK